MSSKEVKVAFARRDSGSESTRELLADFSHNENVVKFSIEDEDRLVADFRELASQGVGGVTHFVFGNSWTGVSVANSIPSSVKDSGFYRQVHVMSVGASEKLSDVPPNSEYIKDHPESLVVVGDDGKIADDEMARTLKEAFTNQAGIILGGGPGHPSDTVYLPVLRQIESGLKSGVSMTSICLGYEMLGEILLDSHGLGKGSQEGVYQVGSTVTRMTKEGQGHEVFGRLGEQVTVVHVNQYRWVAGKGIDQYGEVLAIDSLGDLTAVELGNNVLSWQAHPEFPMIGSGSGYSQKSEEFPVKCGGRIETVVIPKGTSEAYAGLVRDFLGKQFEAFSKEYDFTIEDLRELLLTERLAPHLGVDFYGPVLSYMVQMSKK